MYILFFFNLSFLVQSLFVLGYCPSLRVKILALHVAPAFQQLVKQTIISVVRC